MSRPGRGLAVAAMLALAACRGEVPGFDTPESVLHDETEDVYLVSNIHGAPLAKDNNGYITRLLPDGSMQRYWIQGGRDDVTLHAPKGMALAGDVLWVADIDVLRMFDRTSGRSLGKVEIAGATFLNDVSAAPNGSVYCTDSGLDAKFEATGSDAIYRIAADLAVSVLAKGVELGQPNGLVARPSGVYVVSWRDGTFYQIDYRGTRTDLATAPQGMLDGLVRIAVPADPAARTLARTEWLATSWAGNCIYRFDLVGGVTPMPQRLEQPADLGFDRTRNRLLVPLFGQNRVEFVPL